MIGITIHHFREHHSAFVLPLLGILTPASPQVAQDIEGALSKATDRDRGPRRRLYEVTAASERALAALPTPGRMTKLANRPAPVVTVRHTATSVTDLGGLALAVVVRLEAIRVWLLTCSVPAEARDRHQAEREAHLIDHVEDDHRLPAIHP